MRVGESIYHNKRIKTITSLPKNLIGEVFVIWESNKPSHQVGGCTTFLWKEWIQEGKNEEKAERENKMYVVERKKRRGLTVIRY